MDLKTKYVSLVADIGNFDGTIYDLVVFLRKRAISDLVRMCETQLVNENESFSDVGDTYRDSPFQEGFEEQYEQAPELEEVESVDPVVTPPTNIYSYLDVNLGTKISSFQSVIAYYDSIIAVNGVITDTTNPALDMVNKFKELENVYTTYGSFELSTVYITA